MDDLLSRVLDAHGGLDRWTAAPHDRRAPVDRRPDLGR
jgi:hypothetical protein